MKTKNRFKLIVYVLLGSIVFSLSSCKKDDLLDKSPVTELTPEAITKESDIVALLNSAYDPMQWQVISGASTHMFPVMFQDIRADNCYSQWAAFWVYGPPFDSLPLIQANNTNILALWTKWYKSITRANTAIEFVGKFDKFKTTGLKDRLIAEGKFIRALSYFELVKQFGDVPLITEYISSSAGQLKYPRTPKAEVYTQIEKDLTEAGDVLKWEAAEKGRATKGACYALLAKVYLYQEEWTNAATYCELIINSNTYSLEPNFADNWKLTNEYGRESIFEIGYADGFFSGDWEISGQYNQGSASYRIFGYRANNNRPQDPGPDVAGTIGYGNCIPLKRLIDLYDSTDVRLDATFITRKTVLPDVGPTLDRLNGLQSEYINAPAKETQAVCRKYHLPAAITKSILNIGASPLNEKILRYADVLLMHAEARVMNGAGSLSGLESLNKVIRRAYSNTTSHDLSSYNLNHVKLERRKELATEGWDRFTDLVRWGDAATVLAYKGFRAGRDELLPIPQADIDLVGADILKQNPGY